MKTFELRVVVDGEMVYRLQDNGWKILQNPLGGGTYNSRGEGGWWLYKGDEDDARAQQAKEWAVIKRNMDAYYSQSWV